MPFTGGVGAKILQSALIINGTIPDEIITSSAIDTGVRCPEKKLAGGKAKSRTIE